MSLRRKLLVVLLLTAVLPMLAVRVVQAVSLYRLEADVAEGIRDRLTRQAEQDMQRTVDGYARSLEQEADLIFALLQAQAGEVERRLAAPVPADPIDVPTDRAFARWRDDPLQGIEIRPSERHAFVDAQGDMRPEPVSYDTQVVRLPRGARRPGPRRPDAEDPAPPLLRDQVAKLADMTPAYRTIYDQADDVILWQYTTLETGLHFSYPAKSGFPPGYAPQQRLWYRQAKATGRAIGTRPFVDASTRRLIITFAQPVRDASDQIVGVTAIDVPVGRLLDPGALQTHWADQAQLKIVAGYPAQAEDDAADRFDLAADTSFPRDVYVVADPNQETRGRWRLAQTDTVKFDDDAQRKAIADDLVNARHGVRRVSVDGQDRMVAYGRIGGEGDRPVFAMILAPTDTILEPSERAVTTIEQTLNHSLVTSGAILVGLLIVVFILAYGMSFGMTRPIVELATASRRVAGGSLDARVDFERKDELGELGRAFNEMVPALQDRMRIRDSLHVAMQVQQSLLPEAPPTIPGLDIAGHSEYCDETGGDYYDFIQLDQLGPDTLAIAVGDVTGHGVAAALLMATGRALIRSNANTNDALGDVFTAVNQQLCDGQFTGRFMTLMYLIVQNPAQCRRDDGCVSVRYLSAGHDPVIVYRPADDAFHELAGNDIPLGIDADWTFHEHHADDLRPGDILVVGTDGIWECFNPQGDQFGKARLRDAIRAASSGDAESIAKAITDACSCWRGDRDQEDDITLVVVKLTG
jgi:sigma-B regulation protein RsbU (phosphoserine phosphatase)